MKKYRIAIGFWEDAYNYEIDYIKDFCYKKRAIKWLEKNRNKLYEEEAKPYEKEYYAIDAQIEAWDKEDFIGIIYSIQLCENKGDTK